MLLGLAALAMLMLGLARAVAGDAPSAYENIKVTPGETLWSIAAHRYPDADTRQKVDQIERANGLGGPVIQPGETLKVPID